MKVRFFKISVFIFCIMVLPSAVLRAGDSQGNSFETSTISAPLFSGNLTENLNSFNPMNGLSLAGNLEDVGYFGNLECSQSGDSSFRLTFFDLEEPAGFFWMLDQKFDFRNRWVRIMYSGRNVPDRVFIALNPQEINEKSLFPLYLRKSNLPETSYFKLPADLPVTGLNSIGMVFDPEKSSSGDFTIVGFELLPADADPLTVSSPNDFSRGSNL